MKRPEQTGPDITPTGNPAAHAPRWDFWPSLPLLRAEIEGERLALAAAEPAAAEDSPPPSTDDR